MIEYETAPWSIKKTLFISYYSLSLSLSLNIYIYIYIYIYMCVCVWCVCVCVCGARGAMVTIVKN